MRKKLRNHLYFVDTNCLTFMIIQFEKYSFRKRWSPCTIDKATFGKDFRGKVQPKILISDQITWTSIITQHLKRQRASLIQNSKQTNAQDENKRLNEAPSKPRWTAAIKKEKIIFDKINKFKYFISKLSSLITDLAIINNWSLFYKWQSHLRLSRHCWSNSTWDTSRPERSHVRDFDIAFKPNT